MTAEPSAERVGATPRQKAARDTITRTTVTPAPGTEVADESASGKRQLFGRRSHGELSTAEPPFRVVSMLRLATSVVLSTLSLLTVGGAILVLLLWQQDRASGVLASQLERTWELFDLLRQVERIVAFAAVPVVMAWILVATVNVRRATGERRNPVVAALSVPAAAFGVWYIGKEIVAQSDDWFGRSAGAVLQVIFLAIPLLAVLRVAYAAEARNRPLRVAFIVSVAFIGALQFLGGLSTVDQTSGPDDWGRLGAYLVIMALIQVLGTLSVNEAARAVEEGTDHRFQLRQRFGESVLSQAARG